MMNRKLTNWLTIVIIILAGGAIVFFWIYQNNQPGKLDDFAKCLKDKDVKFYGAFWCPHCQNQKALFGNSKKYLPYVECSTPDGNGQLQICNQEKVQVYPTWKFSDGTSQEGELTLQELSDKSGCQLPK